MPCHDAGLKRASPVLLLILGVTQACADAAADASCAYEAAEQAGLRVDAPASTYFYADDADGLQVGYERGGSVLSLEPGSYQARVNGTLHPVTVRRGQVTECAVATLAVTGTTDAFYYVLDTLDLQLSYARLGEPLSVFAGSYIVKVNETRSEADFTPADTTTLASGTVVVSGTTDEFYYVLDGGDVQLAYAKLGQPLSLLPGSYVARVNSSVAPFTITAGGTTDVRAGAVLGTGTTTDFYYVHDTTGEQLGYARLNTATSYLPGSYQFRLTGSTASIEIVAGQVTEVVTGTLLVQGTSAEYYYILDPAGSQLGYNRLNTPTSLLPGSYGVRVGERTDSVTVTAGAIASLAR